MSILGTAARIVPLAGSPGFFRAARLVRPFSLASFHLVSALAARQRNLGTVLDVGANRGQFSAAAAHQFPDATIHAFEPLLAAAARMRKSVGARANIRLWEFALGAKSGSRQFYEYEYSHISSFLPIRDGNQNPKYCDASGTRISVRVERLDALGLDLSHGPVLLKIDAQGAEREVLEGAAGVLAQVDLVLLEVPFEQLYEGQPLFDELHDTLHEFGYRLDAPLATHHGHAGRIIEMDVLYRRCET